VTGEDRRQDICDGCADHRDCDAGDQPGESQHVVETFMGPIERHRFNTAPLTRPIP
jgi:hypothetical protein